MSFGFSVGDFVTVGRLIHSIVSSLRASSVTEYRELVLELDGLQRALDHIEHLQCLPGQEAAINGVKVAALLCQYPLDEFAGKLKKFESIDKGGKATASEKLKSWTQKLRWGFCMDDEVRKLRAYLMVHVGSLNMRLITQGLSIATLTASQDQGSQGSLEAGIERTHKDVIENQRNIEVHGTVTRNNESLFQRLFSAVTSDLVSQLRHLVNLADKIWHSNVQVMNLIVKLQTSGPSPELRYTWAQEPVKFEDALGRVIPIPSEYSWATLDAIILTQFPTGIGHHKVLAGEYELYNTKDQSQVVSRSETEQLAAGLSITMAVIFGQYNFLAFSRCPRLSCRAFNIVQNEAGGWFCAICQAYFGYARKSLPLPLRPTRGDRKRKRDSSLLVKSHHPVATTFKKAKLERQKIKNVRIHPVPLAATPHISNVRRRKEQRVPSHSLRWTNRNRLSEFQPMQSGSLLQQFSDFAYRRVSGFEDQHKLSETPILASAPGSTQIFKSLYPAKTPLIVSAPGSMQISARLHPTQSAVIASAPVSTQVSNKVNSILSDTSVQSMLPIPNSNRSSGLGSSLKPQGSIRSRSALCMRCRFLNLTCHLVRPCPSCRTSKLRPCFPCTDLRVVDLDSFLNYPRYEQPLSSVNRLGGPANLITEGTFITHGNGHRVAIVFDKSQFRIPSRSWVDWVEVKNHSPTTFRVRTSAIPPKDYNFLDGPLNFHIASYLERHLDNGFQDLLDQYYGATSFTSDILKLCYHIYIQHPYFAIREGLLLVITHILAFHIVLVDHELNPEVALLGRVEDLRSRNFGQTVAPAAVQHEMKMVLALAWGRLHRSLLQNLSHTFKMVLTKGKKEYFSCTLVLSMVLLIIWEQIHFDAFFNEDQDKADTLRKKMESIPVPVIISLFHETKGLDFESFDMITDLRDIVSANREYLKDCKQAKFDHNNFASISNKYVSQLFLP